MTEPEFSSGEAYLRDRVENDHLRINCPTCDYRYLPGRESEERLHAEWHADYEFWLRCSQPDSRLEAYGGDVRVDETSPEWLHAIVYGHSFGMTFCSAQWNTDRPSWMDDDQRDLHAIILVEEKFTPVGAVAFSQIIRDGRAPVWRMMFASVHEDWRRKGVMSRRWPGWRETYGDFELEEPLSRAMKAFVAKIAHSAGEGSR